MVTAHVVDELACCVRHVAIYLRTKSKNSHQPHM